MVKRCKSCKTTTISTGRICDSCRTAPPAANVGVKHDKDKPDLSLLPKPAKEGIARAFMYGAGKYGRNNYKKGMNWTRVLAAADRHLSAFNDGENFDKESKLNHLYHAGACIMMLIEYYDKNLGTDDRNL